MPVYRCPRCRYLARWQGVDAKDEDVHHLCKKTRTGRPARTRYVLMEKVAAHSA